jgi:hypothetical protein
MNLQYTKKVFFNSYYDYWGVDSLFNKNLIIFSFLSVKKSRCPIYIIAQKSQGPMFCSRRKSVCPITFCTGPTLVINIAWSLIDLLVKRDGSIWVTYGFLKFRDKFCLRYFMRYDFFFRYNMHFLWKSILNSSVVCFPRFDDDYSYHTVTTPLVWRCMVCCKSGI